MNLKIVSTAALFTSLTLSAQATTMHNSSHGDLTKIVYSCEGKKTNTLEVVFVNSEKNAYAIINQVNEMVPMVDVPTGSGTLYKAINKNYTYELYTKGNTAELSEGGKTIAQCINN